MTEEWVGGFVPATPTVPPGTVGRWRRVSVSGLDGDDDVADRTTVAYRTTVGDPRSSRDERAFVRIDHPVERFGVWADGTRLGEHSGSVQPSLFEFDPDGVTDVTVVVPTSGPTGREDGHSAVVETPADESRVEEGTGAASATATDEPPSVLDAVSIECRPRTFVQACSVQAHLGDEGGAIDVDLTLDAGEAVDDAVTFSVRPVDFRGRGSMDRTAVEADAGECVTVSTHLSVEEPKRWWPRGYGDQHRYAVHVKFGEHSLERTVGFRTVERTAHELRINGEPVCARGFTLDPAAHFEIDPARYFDPDQYLDPAANAGATVDSTATGGVATESDAPVGTSGIVDDVDRAIEANANLVRFQSVAPRAVYDHCDAAGVLVWQDLPAATDAVESDSNARADLNAIGSHPSVAIYGGGSVAVDPFTSPIGTGRLARLRYRWRVWRASSDRSDAEAVAETVAATTADGGAVVIPVTGPPGTGADAVTLFPGWQYLAATDVDWLLDRDPTLADVVADFGAGSLASGSDASTVDGPDGERGVSPPDAPPDAPSEYDYRSLVGPGGGFEVASVPATDADRRSLIAPSQAYQTQVLATVTGALRRHGAAVLTTTLRDCDPAGGMGVLAADGTEKPAFEAVSTAYEPVQVFPAAKSGPAGAVVVCNDGPERHAFTLRWDAGASTGETTVTVGPHDRSVVDDVDLPPDGEPVDFTLELPSGSVRNRCYLS